MSKCFGIKIILQDKDNPVSQNTDIGLYSVSGNNSEFRWIQNEISGLSSTWKHGIIIAGGIEKFTTEINLYNGGNTSSPGSGSVKLNNLNKIWKTIEDLDINIRGLKLEIWILGTGNYQKRLRTYFCKEPSWKNTVYEIQFEGQQTIRVSNIMQVITEKDYPNASKDTIGRDIPATFGKLFPKINADGSIDKLPIAKFVRTDDKVLKKYYSDDFFTNSGYTNTILFPYEEEVMPSTRLHREFKFSFRGSESSGLATHYFDDTYMYIAEGGGSGQIRKIYSMNYGTGNTFTIMIDDFLAEAMNNTDDRSWIQIIKVNRCYAADHFPCKGFFDFNGNQLASGAEIYTYTNDDGIQLIAPYGYDFRDVNDANNQIKIDPKLYEDAEMNQQNSFLILPVNNLHLADDATLINWDNGTETIWHQLNKHSSYDGLYAANSADFPDSINNYSLSNHDYAGDKNYDTYAYHGLDALQNTNYGWGYFKVLFFDLPQLPENFTFSNVYIGVKLKTFSQSGDSGGEPDYHRLYIRRFKYKVEFMEHWLIDETTGDGAIVDNLPDFYYSNNYNTGNKNFFVTEDSDDQLVTGIYNSVFDTGITTIEEYESYIQGMLVFERAGTTGSLPVSWDDDLYLYELCFIFKRSSDISKNLYITHAGRVFSYTWQGRKATTDLIDKPYDALEHVCRLQNYQDTCNIPVSGWGLQYADEPQIATDGWGSFDDPDLASARNYEVACQIVDRDNGYTDKIKQNICNEFVLANWQDNDGYERVIALPNSKLDPVYTIQMNDILDRKKIKVNEREYNSIISEPWVSYNKNPATGDYEDIIKITNTTASAYSTNYVSGIEKATDAENLWNSCHSLALKTHSINKPSTSKTDLQWANGPGAYTIALKYLQNWINWQFTNEMEFPVHFNLAESWQECTPINLLFSHQTGNISKSALIEKITIDPRGYEAMIKAIMYG